MPPGTRPRGEADKVSVTDALSRLRFPRIETTRGGGASPTTTAHTVDRRHQGIFYLQAIPMFNLLFAVFTRFIAIAALTTAVAAHPALAAPKTYTLNGRLQGKAGFVVMLVEQSGRTRSVPLKQSGNFSFKKLALKTLRNASLQLIDKNGRYAGPVVLGTKGAKASIRFSGKAPSAAAFELGKLTLKSGYATLKKNKLLKSVYLPPTIPTIDGKPSGAGELGLVAAPAGIVSIRAAEDAPGADPDRDGVPNAFDVDDDGDLVLDATDPDSQGAEIPYTGLNFRFFDTRNAHVGAGLSDEIIDAIVAGENIFSLTFFIALAPEQSNIDGGHVVCDDALTYCRRNNPLGFYGGIVESSPSFRNRPWADLLTIDGYPRMEKIDLSGGSAIVASIQPRVGGAVFRPGDVYQVNLTQGSTVRQTRSLALAPYFVSIPALERYNTAPTDPEASDVTVDYSNASAIPGNSTGNPIILSSEGLLRVRFWRPQREPIRSDETGYYDWGNLNYGLIIEQAQATCAGLYSDLEGVTEASNSLGTGGSPFANQGAKLSPLVDNTGDRRANIANTIAFTVDLKTCLARAGLSPGTYTIPLRAAGTPVTGGEISAVQTFVVQIP